MQHGEGIPDLFLHRFFSVAVYVRFVLIAVRQAARAADAPELKKAVLNDVPGWVRWLVKPYLKSNEEQE